MPIKDKSLYPANWEAIRKRILERAEHTCEKCGAINYQAHPVTGSKVILTIAHWYDKNPTNVEEDNLKALCQQCHNSIDSYDRQKTRRITQLEGLLCDLLPLLEDKLEETIIRRKSFLNWYASASMEKRQYYEDKLAGMEEEFKTLKKAIKIIKKISQ